MYGILYKHLSDKSEKVSFEAGETIKENLPDIDFKNAVILVNGKKTDPDIVLREGDTVMIRVLPAAMTTVAIVAAVGAIVAIGAAVGVGIYAYNQKTKLNEELEKLKKQSNNDSIDNRPFIRGASNSLATGKSQPYMCGRHLFTPYLLSYPFYKITGTDGGDQFYYAVFECGFNKQVLQQIKVDDIVIKDFTGSVPQQGAYGFNSGSLFADENSQIEIIQNGGLFTTIPELNVKTIAETANKQVPYADQIADKSKTPLQFTLSENSKSVDVVITFNNGLFAYNDNNDKITTSIDIIPEYSLNNGGSWTPFNFNQNGSKSNTFSRNIQKEIRFTAHHDFTQSEVVNRNTSILIQVRTSANKDNKKTNTCYVMYIQSTCFDAEEWRKNKRFVDCRIVQERERAFCTMLGIRIKATAANEDKLNKINIITQSIARIWDGSKWSTAKNATRNPAAILLEMVTSDTHSASKFDDEEIDLPSFGDLYEYCEQNQYRYDKVITDGGTKQDTINQILSVCDSLLYRNIHGKLSIATDTVKSNAIAVFNSQNIISIENRKEFKRRTDGLRIKFVNAAAGFTEDSYLVMRKDTALTQDSVLREVTVDGITEQPHIVTYARRLMAGESLRAKITTVQIGQEGVFFTPFSKILLQDDSFKIGLSSGTIQEVCIEHSAITRLKLYDVVEFRSGYQYGMTINCINETAASIASVKVKGSGFTTEVELVTPIQIPPPQMPQLHPSAGDTFSFGLLNDNGGFDKISSPFLITGMNKTESGYSLELVDYNEALYETGDIPEYKSNITEKPSDSKSEIKPDYVTKDDLFEIVGTDKGTDYPDDVFGVSAAAARDYIRVKWQAIKNGLKNRLQKYTVQISKDNGKTFIEFETGDIEYIYNFNRITDGYPERETLQNYRIRVKAVNMFGKESLQWSTPVLVETSNYLTWVPAVPHFVVSASARNVSLGWASQGSGVYGNTVYDLQIAKIYQADGTQNITDLTDNTNWFAPQNNSSKIYEFGASFQTLLNSNDFTKLGYKYHYGDLKEAWHTQESCIEVRGTSFSQSLPLDQEVVKVSSTNSKDEEVHEALATVAENTAYQYRIRARNLESGNVSAWSGNNQLGMQVTATASSAYDVVKNAFNTASIINGSITVEKLFVEVLSGISANLGKITDGALYGNENCYLYFSAIPEEDRKAGDFKFSNGNGDYIQGYTDANGQYYINLKASKFEITAVGTIVKGAFYVSPSNATVDNNGVPSSYYLKSDTSGTTIAGNLIAPVVNGINQSKRIFFEDYQTVTLLFKVPAANTTLSIFGDVFLNRTDGIGNNLKIEINVAWDWLSLRNYMQNDYLTCIECTYNGIKYIGLLNKSVTAHIAMYNVITHGNIEFIPLRAEQVSITRYVPPVLNLSSGFWWKNYGRGHTIVDNSDGALPGGNRDSQIAWSGTYPVIMGYNGVNTYGVRVDSCRIADTATITTNAKNAQFATDAGNAVEASKAFALMCDHKKVIRPIFSFSVTRNLNKPEYMEIKNIFNTVNESMSYSHTLKVRINAYYNLALDPGSFCVLQTNALICGYGTAFVTENGYSYATMNLAAVGLSPDPLESGMRISIICSIVQTLP